MNSISNSGAAFANTVNVTDAARVSKVSVDVKANEDRQTNNVDKSLTSAPETTAKVKSFEADTNTREVSRELQTAITQMQDFASSADSKLAFTVDEKTERSVVTLKDKDSGDVIRQIPSQELLDIAAQVQKITSENGSAVGLLVNGKY